MQMNMDKFEEIECIQSSDEMNKIFPKEDLVYIKEIIRRPFPFVHTPSDNKKISFWDASSSNKSNTSPHSNNHINRKHSGKGGTKKKKIHRKRRKTVRRR
jgi:hypothetical protein